MSLFSEFMNYVFTLDPIVPAIVSSTIITGLARSTAILVKHTKGLPWRERIHRSGSALFDWFVAWGALYLVSLAAVYVFGALAGYWNEIVGLVHTPYAVMLSIGAAGLLFKLRARHPAAYGGLELLVALAVLYYATTKSDESPAVTTTALLGGIYVFIRGLDNIGKRRPRFLDRVWAWIT